MFAIENFISYEVVQKIGWVLLHFIWQAAAVTFVLAFVLRILRRFSANTRYIAACLALLIVVIMPFATMRFIKVETPPAAPVLEEAASNVLLPAITANEVTFQTPAAEKPAKVVYIEPEPVVTERHINFKERAVTFLEPKLSTIVTIWLLGVFSLAIWHLGGYAQLQNLRKKMVKQVDSSLHDKLKVLAQKLGVTQTVQLLESALVQIPTVIGWLKPVILLPASAITGLSTEQLEAILAHELAHIKRYDYLVNIIQTIVEIFGFYHPAVWWISHKIRCERENCCDDIAVAICGDRINYAKALASMEEIRSRDQFAIAATGGNLFSRICRLIGKDTNEKNALSWIPSLIAILLLIALAIPTTIAFTSSRGDNDGNLNAETVLNKVRQAQRPYDNMQIEWEDEIPGTTGVLAGGAPPQIQNIPILTKRKWSAALSGNRFRLNELQETYYASDPNNPGLVQDITHAFDGVIERQLEKTTTSTGRGRIVGRILLDSGIPYLLQQELFGNTEPQIFDEEKIKGYLYTIKEGNEPDILILDLITTDQWIRRHTIDKSKGYNIIKYECLRSNGTTDYEDNIKLKQYPNGHWFISERERYRYNFNDPSVKKLEKKVIVNDIKFGENISSDTFSIQYPEGTNFQIKPFDYGIGKEPSIREVQSEENQDIKAILNKPSVSDKKVFGPVIERTIHSLVQSKNCFIDFDTGNIFDVPKDFIRNSEHGDWFEQNGIDATIGTEINYGRDKNTDLCGLATLHCMVIPLSNERWNKVTAEACNEVFEKLPLGQTPLMSAEVNLPATYLFQTLDHRGILQILEAKKENQLHSVKIRYKLIQDQQGNKTDIQAENIDSGTKVLIEAQVINVSDDFLKQVGLDSDSLKKSNEWTKNRVDNSSNPFMFTLDSINKEALLENIDKSHNASSISNIFMMLMSDINKNVSRDNTGNSLLAKNQTLLILGGKQVSLQDMENSTPILKNTPVISKFLKTISKTIIENNEIILIKATIVPNEQDDDLKVLSDNVFISQLVRINFDLSLLEPGQYVEIKNNGKRDFTIKQVNCPPGKKFPCYGSNIDFDIRSNLDFNLATKRYSRGPLSEHGKWDAHFTDPNTISGNGDFSTTTLSVSASDLNLYQGILSNTVLDDSQVSLVEIQIQPAKAENLSEYQKTLPSGVTVELIGMCEFPSLGKKWYKPDGKPLENPPYNESESDILSVIPPDSIPIEFAFRLIGDFNEPAWEAQVKTDKEDFVWWTGRRSKNGEYVRDIKSIGMFVKLNQESINLKLGFSINGKPHEWAEFNNISVKNIVKTENENKQVLIEMTLLEVNEKYLKDEATFKELIKGIPTAGISRVQDTNNLLFSTAILDDSQIGSLFNEKNENIKTLARPALPALDNKESTISLISKIPYVTGYTEPVNSNEISVPVIVETDVGFNGTFTPHVVPDKNDIVMEFALNNRFIFGYEERIFNENHKDKVPLIAQSEIESTALISRGKTFIANMGEVKPDVNNPDSAKEKKNLIVLVKPVIVQPRQTGTRIPMIAPDSNQVLMLDPPADRRRIGISEKTSDLADSGQIDKTTLLETLRKYDALYIENGFSLTGVNIQSKPSLRSLSHPDQVTYNWQMTFKGHNGAITSEVVRPIEGFKYIRPEDYPNYPKKGVESSIVFTAPQVIIKQQVYISINGNGLYDEETLFTVAPDNSAQEIFTFPSVQKVDEPDLNYISLNVIGFMLGIGRGYSEYIDEIIEIEKQQDGMIRVKAKGHRNEVHTGRWELVIDTSKDWMVRHAKYFRDENPEIVSSEIVNSGLKRNGKLTYPSEAKVNSMGSVDQKNNVSSLQFASIFEGWNEQLFNNVQNAYNEGRIRIRNEIYNRQGIQYPRSSGTSNTSEQNDETDMIGSPANEFIINTSEKTKRLKSEEIPDTNMVQRTYDIVDIVYYLSQRNIIINNIPIVDMRGAGGSYGGIPNGTLVFEAQEIVKKIMNSIEPYSWYEINKQAKGTINPYPASSPKKLAVTNTHEVHTQIEKFLESVRESIDYTQVSIEMRYIYGTEQAINEILISIGIRESGAAILDDMQVTKLIKDIQRNQNAKFLVIPKVTVLNDETAIFQNIGQQPVSPDQINPFLKITPRVSKEEDFVYISFDDSKPVEWHDSNRPPDISELTHIETRLNIPNGQTCAFSNYENNQQDSSSDKKSLILIKPTIILPEEEKEITDEGSLASMKTSPANTERVDLDRISFEAQIFHSSDAFIKQLGLDANSLKNSDTWSKYIIDDAENSKSFLIDPLSADLLRKSIHGNRGSKIYAGIKFESLYEPESKAVIEIPTKERYMLSGKPSEIFKPENVNVISDPLEHTEPYAVISLTPAIIEGNKIKLDANLKINEFVSPYSELAINGEMIQKGRTLKEKEKEKNTKTTNVLKVFEKSLNTIISNDQSLLILGPNITESMSREGSYPLIRLPILDQLLRTKSGSKIVGGYTILVLIKAKFVSKEEAEKMSIIPGIPVKSKP